MKKLYLVSCIIMTSLIPQSMQAMDFLKIFTRQKTDSTETLLSDSHSPNIKKSSSLSSLFTTLSDSSDENNSTRISDFININTSNVVDLENQIPQINPLLDRKMRSSNPHPSAIHKNNHCCKITTCLVATSITIVATGIGAAIYFIH